jgi:hypothetical protein
MRHDTEDAYRTGTAIAEGGPDIRGWSVVGSDGRRIGTVHDLRVDTLDVALDRELLPGAPGGREHHGEEGQPVPGAEVMGFTATPDEGPGVVRTSATVRNEVEPVTGHLDDSVNRPGHDSINETVGAAFLEAARAHPLFTQEDRPITGRLDEAGLETGAGRHVLIPISGARVDERDNRVHVDLQSTEAAALPAHHHE